MYLNAYLLACFYGILGLLSYIIQDCLSRSFTAHNSVRPLESIINQENAPWTYPEINKVEKIPQPRFPKQR